MEQQDDVADDPDHDDDGLDRDEPPAAQEPGDPVGDPRAEGRVVVHRAVDFVQARLRR